MNLSTLPLVVLDTLLPELDLECLVALSSTCRSLHAEGNRVLYREPAFRWLSCNPFQFPDAHAHDSPTDILERSLSKYSANTLFLKAHRSHDVKLLQEIWSRSRLTLTWLEICSIWFASSNAQEVVECIDSKHRDTYVKAICLHSPESDHFRGILSSLHTFHGFEVLDIKGSMDDFSPDGVID